MKFRKIKITKIYEDFIEKIGIFVGFLIIALVLVINIDVILRYGFNNGSVAAQELEWHIFAAIFLLGGVYAQKKDAHVRVDFIYKSNYLSSRWRNLIDLLGTLFFLIPFCLIIIYGSVPFILDSYIHGEGSPDPGGLKFRWLIKACILVGFFAMFLFGVINSVKLFKQFRGECND